MTVDRGSSGHYGDGSARETRHSHTGETYSWISRFSTVFFSTLFLKTKKKSFLESEKLGNFAGMFESNGINDMEVFVEQEQQDLKGF